jgi:hypothetical protein
MENTSKSKWPVRLAVLAIFGLGFIAGVLTLSLYHARHFTFLPRFSRSPLFMFKSITERLSLTSEQQREVEKILDDARQQLTELRRQSEPRLGEIRRQIEQRLQQVLTPEQWKRFEQMRTEMLERRGWRRENRNR